MERTITLDSDLARRADRKLHRYGMSLDDAVAHTLVFVVSTRGNPWQNRALPDGSAVDMRRMLQSAKDVEDGREAAKGYTDMAEMLRDLEA